MKQQVLGLVGAWLLSGLNTAIAAPVPVDISAFSGTALNIDAEVNALLTDQFAGDGLVISGGASAREVIGFGFPPEAGDLKGYSLTGPPFVAAERITFDLSSRVNLFGGYFAWNADRVLQFDIGLGPDNLGSISFVNDRGTPAATFVGISNLTPFDRVVITALIADSSALGRTTFIFDLLRFEAFPPTDVPEPGTFALLGLGLAGLGLTRRRKGA